jgi:hypothetical protein
MDVVLGVAVTGPVARLALIGPGARGADVIDQSVVDLADNPIETLTETVVGTNRLLAGENHRLTATRLCWTDHPKADQLRRALEDSGVTNVAVLSESQAVTALMRAAGRPGAALVVDDEMATLSLPGSTDADEDAPPTLLASGPLAGGSGDQATATLDTLMARLGEQPNAPGDIYLVGASSDLNSVADQIRGASTMRVEIPDDPTFALARGAAMAAVPQAVLAAGDATAMAPAVGFTGDETAMAPAAGLTGDETAFAPAAEPPAEEQQLAYSMAEEGEPFGADEFGDEYGDFDEAETGQLPLSRRSLVLGNAVIAFAVIGLASLAVAVTVAVRPTSSQQPVVGHQNAAPGKFMPLLPTQQQAPVPAPPPDQPNAGFQGGVIPDSNGYIPPQLMTPGAGGTPPVAPVNPAPVAPGVPGFMPNPNGPIPVPIIIPFPGWRPLPPPYVPPYTPPTTPTTIPTSPTKTPYTPPTTTYSPPTTTYSPPTTTHTPPTTTYSPPTTTYSPPTSTHAPPTTSYSPPTQTQTPTHTQQTVTPQPTHTQQPNPQQPVTPQQPVIPQQPHNRRGF